MSIDAFEEPGEVVAGEGPIEGPRRLLVAILEAKQLLLEIGEGCEVVRREKLALNDREVDLDLIKPAGMHGVCTRTRFGHLAWRRRIARRPRWDEPLSTIQNTLRAER